MEYIQGEKFMNLANDIDIIYRHTHNVNSFFEHLPMISDFILISHNSDNCITENPRQGDADSKLMPSNLLMWFGQNVCIRNDRIKSLPIGLENNEWLLKPRKMEKMIAKLSQSKEIKKLMYMNFNISTNPYKRIRPRQLFEGTSWVTVVDGRHGYEFDAYIDNIYNHKFVICPEGNGIDTHRVWETLYMGTIPIEKRSINNQFHTDLPICFVDGWKEVTETFLEDEYIRIKQSAWNMDKLDFGYWKNEIICKVNEMI